MKLNHDQIEAERKRFIAYRQNERGRKVIMNSDFGGPHVFNLENDRQCFDVWLACRESNNEIELPDPDFYFTPSGKTVFYYEPKVIQEIFQSQGFHVKSQGE